MDIRSNLAIISDQRIERCKKHLVTDILLLCIIAMVCGVECYRRYYLFRYNPSAMAETILGVTGTESPARILFCVY